MDEMEPHPPDMEQRFSDRGDSSMVADYITETRDELKTVIKNVFLTIARMTYLMEPDIKETALREAKDGFSRYFQSMKGQTNLSEPDVDTLIGAEVTRQQTFYRGLFELKERFKKQGIDLDTLPPENVYCEPVWDTGFTVGTTIQVDKKTYLYGSPPVHAESSSYMALVQEPVAAGIIAADKDYILFLPSGQDTDDRFVDACSAIFDPGRDITGEIDGAWQAFLGDGYILVDGERQLSENEINELKRRHSVSVVVTANSSQFTATIHCRSDAMLERLYEEIGLR